MLQNLLTRAAARCSFSSSSRAYPKVPILAVSSVVCTPHSVLLVRRQKPPHVGVWSLPGGRVNLGETVAEAASRELLEETGLTVQNLRSFGCTDAIFRDDEGGIQFHYVIAHLVAQLEHELDPVAGDDAETCRWTPLEDLENHIVVTEAETAEGIDPYVQDCISLNVKETVRNGMLNWKMVMELS